MENKTCTVCSKQFSVDMFYKNGSKSRRSACKLCAESQKRKLRSMKSGNNVSVLEKECRTCGVVKSEILFTRDRNSSDGLCTQCKSCRKLNTDKYYINNIEKIRESRLEYYYDNKEKAIMANRKYQAQKMKEDPFYVMARRLRNRLYYALKNTIWKKTSKFMDYIGCDRQTLISHIESQFQPGMNWDNRELWHIDHIIPLSSAKEETDLYKLSHYMNLQPLWAIDNIKKGAKS